MKRSEVFLKKRSTTANNPLNDFLPHNKRNEKSEDEKIP